MQMNDHDRYLSMAQPEVQDGNKEHGEETFTDKGNLEKWTRVINRRKARKNTTKEGKDMTTETKAYNKQRDMCDIDASSRAITMRFSLRCFLATTMICTMTVFDVLFSEESTLKSYLQFFPSNTTSADNHTVQHNNDSLEGWANGTVQGWPNPTLVMGMPKSGTSTIAKYFGCNKSLSVSHWECHKGGDYCGILIHDNLVNGRPPFSNTGRYDVYAQMDYTYFPEEVCHYPQVEALEEIHKHYPNSTFILNLRDPEKWVQSLFAWYKMAERFVLCNISGFPVDTRSKEEFVSFYLDHSEKIRRFVANHPSHKLVEIHIDSPDAGEQMENYFGINKTCWGHSLKRFPSRQ